MKLITFKRTNERKKRKKMADDMKEPGGIRLLSCSKKGQRYNEKEREKKINGDQFRKKDGEKKTARSGMSEHLGK